MKSERSLQAVRPCVKLLVLPVAARPWKTSSIHIFIGPIKTIRAVFVCFQNFTETKLCFQSVMLQYFYVIYYGYYPVRHYFSELLCNIRPTRTKINTRRYWKQIFLDLMEITVKTTKGQAVSEYRWCRSSVRSYCRQWMHCNGSITSCRRRTWCMYQSHRTCTTRPPSCPRSRPDTRFSRSTLCINAEIRHSGGPQTENH